MTDTDAGAAPAAPAPEPASPSLPETPSTSAREAVDRAFASVDREEAQPPRPIQSQTQPEEKLEPKREAKPEAKKPEAKAPEKPKAEARPAEKTEAKAETKPQPQRAPNGQFAPKEAAEGEGADAVSSPAPAPKPSAFPEAPKRFSPDAHADWQNTPEPVRAETHRAFRELEQGLQKYKGDADAFNELRQFDDLAKQSGTTLKDAMARYVGIEQKLHTDFIGGLEEICANRGITLRDLAARIVGAKPEESASRQDATIRELRAQVAHLTQQVGGVSKTIEQQRTEGVMSQVAAFAAEPGHDRFEELSGDIKFFLESKRAGSLAEAYELAERLNPAPARAAAATPPAAIPQPKPDDAAQTRKGTLGIHGAPSSGSDPATRKPPSSARNAVDEAFARLGL